MISSLSESGESNPVAPGRKDALRLDFARRSKLEFHGTKITSDAGLLGYREFDEALRLTSAIDSEDQRKNEPKAKIGKENG